MLPGLVGPFQSTFFAGRNISDIISYFVKNFFIIIIDMEGGAPRCSLKVDLMSLRLGEMRFLIGCSSDH